MKDDNRKLSSPDINNESDCIEAVMRYREHMRPLMMIVSDDDGILHRQIDVGRMLIMAEMNLKPAAEKLPSMEELNELQSLITVFTGTPDSVLDTIDKLIAFRKSIE